MSKKITGLSEYVSRLEIQLQIEQLKHLASKLGDKQLQGSLRKLAMTNQIKCDALQPQAYKDWFHRQRFHDSRNVPSR